MNRPRSGRLLENTGFEVIYNQVQFLKNDANGNLCCNFVDGGVSYRILFNGEFEFGANSAGDIFDYAAAVGKYGC